MFIFMCVVRNLMCEICGHLIKFVYIFDVAFYLIVFI